MNLQTQTLSAAGVFVLNGNETFFPPRRQNGSLLPYAVGVIAECLVKWRTFADAAINQISILRATQ